MIRSQVKGLVSNNNNSIKSINSEHIVNSKSQYSDIDTSPITTPENIDQTRLNYCYNYYKYIIIFFCVIIKKIRATLFLIKITILL